MFLTYQGPDTENSMVPVQSVSSFIPTFAAGCQPYVNTSTLYYKKVGKHLNGNVQNQGMTCKTLRLAYSRIISKAGNYIDIHRKLKIIYLILHADIAYRCYAQTKLSRSLRW